MSIDKLKNILDSIPCKVMIDFIESSWMRSESEIYWNWDNNLHHLVSGSGNTCVVEYYRGGIEHQGYFIVNAEDGCGETNTMFFNLSAEVKFKGNF